MGRSFFVPSHVEVEQGAPHLTFCQEWDLLAGIPTFALHTDESKPPESQQNTLDVGEQSLIWEMVHQNMVYYAKFVGLFRFENLYSDVDLLFIRPLNYFGFV
eukprot:TRINITY_DN1955_c0_g1_i2.p1 TRINITY_DN1955_c0_g1~~TRINITY_DN1955_c0_g1_i2.p1  ORF type:complete len:112 (+),score=8.50 TRINITY_DN1955_c0_g1_i2:33-338(+)